jgi:transcriptional regulator with XRE-family HTH domain
MNTPATHTMRFDGHRLRAERIAVGLNRRHVATGANLTSAMIKAMEGNRVRPSDAAFARLCNVLGLTIAAGRAKMMVPGPADHRPDEYAVAARVSTRPRRSLTGLAGQQHGRQFGKRDDAP